MFPVTLKIGLRSPSQIACFPDPNNVSMWLFLEDVAVTVASSAIVGK